MNTTAFFDSWFKKSKVRDKSKQTLTVYHGTTNDFTVFKTNPLEAKAFYGFGQTVIGAFFSESKEIASSYPRSYSEPNRKVISVFLSIQNPKKYRSLQGLSRDIITYVESQNETIGTEPKDKLQLVFNFKEHLISQGYDGIVPRRTHARTIEKQSEGLGCISF